MLIFRSEIGDGSSVPGTREHGSDPFPKDHVFFGRFLMWHPVPSQGSLFYRVRATCSVFFSDGERFPEGSNDYSPADPPESNVVFGFSMVGSQTVYSLPSHGEVGQSSPPFRVVLGATADDSGSVGFSTCLLSTCDLRPVLDLPTGNVDVSDGFKGGNQYLGPTTIWVPPLVSTSLFGFSPLKTVSVMERFECLN